MATVRLFILRIIVISVVGKRDAASTASSRWVPAAGDVGIRAKSTAREETIVAEGVYLSAGNGLNLSTLGVEQHVTVEIARTALAFTTSSTCVGHGDAFTIEHKLGVSGLVTWVAAGEVIGFGNFDVGLVFLRNSDGLAQSDNGRESDEELHDGF